MSIETAITAIADAIKHGSQAIIGLSASIDRYCDIIEQQPNGSVTTATAQTVKEPQATDTKAEASVTTEVDEAEDSTDAQTADAQPETDTTAEAPVTESKTYVYDDVKAVVLDALRAGKKAQVGDLFNELGIKNAQELEPAQYADFITKMETL